MSVLVSLISMFFELFKIPLFLLGVFFILLFVSSCIWFLVFTLRGRRLKRGKRRVVKGHCLLRKVFIDAPRQYVQDMFDKNPDFFNPCGLVIYTGAQGDGKTISMVRDAMLLQKEYPLCKCISNLNYKNEDTALFDWRQLIDYKNGIYGVIVMIDEIQNWFSSKQSKDFPPEMFEVVTQNRKNRRVIFATTQNFYQPSKDIRAQCCEVRKCLTFFGVFTVVHRLRPVIDTNGDVKEFKHIQFYCFPHTQEIRQAYDTYKVIESLAKSGFKPKNRVAVEMQSK